MAEQSPNPVHAPVSPAASAPTAPFQSRFHEPDATVLVCHGLQFALPAANFPGCTRHVPASRGGRRTPSSAGSAQREKDARELQRRAKRSPWCQFCILLLSSPQTIERILRKMATPPVCGKIIISTTRTISIHGSTCVSRKKSLSQSKGILDMLERNHPTQDNKCNPSNVNSLLPVSQCPRPLPTESENMPLRVALHLCTPLLLEEIP